MNELRLPRHPKYMMFLKVVFDITVKSIEFSLTGHQGKLSHGGVLRMPERGHPVHLG